MTVHVISETEFLLKGQGVHTAFIDHVELLREKHDIDVVINAEGSGNVFHSHTYGPYFFWKGRPYKGKRVYTVHVIPDSIKGSLPFWELWFPFVKWYFRKVYSYADVCIAISPQVEKAIRELGSKTKIVKISNPVHVEKWKFSKEKRLVGRRMFGIADNEFVVLGVGQLETRKGVEDFLDIAELYPEVRFLWVGGRPFGAFTEGINKLNHRIQNASKHIKFSGLVNLEDMPNVYAASDVLIFPSYQENCPLAPIEAAACGLPVVFRDLNEYKLLYEHEYLKAKNTNEFLDLVKRLHQNPQFYSEAAILSKQLITQFDKQIIREKLLSLYSELNNNKLSA